MDVPVTRQFESGRQNSKCKVVFIFLSSLRITTDQFTTMSTHDICIRPSMDWFRKGALFHFVRNLLWPEIMYVRFNLVVLCHLIGLKHKMYFW